MKLLYYAVAICFTLIACSENGLKNQGFPNLESLPESVSMNGAGDGVNADQASIEGDQVTIEVEAPSGTQKDIIVTYSLGGTAIFGTDYTISGATASGGTVTIVSDPGNVNDFDKGTIIIDALNDLLNDEENETVIITLISATRDNENIAVGRGGTEHGRTATVTISNFDLFVGFSPAKRISAYESDEREQTFYVELSTEIGVDLTYDLIIESPSGFVSPANYTFTGNSVNPGVGLTIEAGQIQDTVSIRLVDNLTRTTSPMGLDSVNFYIENASSSGSAIPVGAVGTNRDTLVLYITDDIKEYGFTSLDAVSVTSSGVHVFEVTLLSSNRGNVPVLADVDIDIAYTVSGTAVAGTDYNDVSAGQITLLQGETTANIRIEILRTGEDPVPTLTLTLGAATTTDGEVNGANAAGNEINVTIGG